MERSLMLSAGQPGMSHQDVADGVAYLKQEEAPPVRASADERRKILFIAGNPPHSMDCPRPAAF
ncbi:MAG: hypothetical protein AAF492_18325 [Verrucomicrobiota bacterium]